jgi:hypothetical protein
MEVASLFRNILRNGGIWDKDNQLSSGLTACSDAVMINGGGLDIFLPCNASGPETQISRS